MGGQILSQFLEALLDTSPISVEPRELRFAGGDLPTEKVLVGMGHECVTAASPLGRRLAKPAALEALRKTREFGPGAKRTQVCGRCQRIAHKRSAMR